MLANDLKTALRHFRRHKGYAAINVVGLTIGMTACLLIFLFVRYETSYDRFHRRADRIHRVIQRDEADGETDVFCGTPAPLAPALLREFPEVERAVRIARSRTEIIVRGRRFHEQVFAVDTEIFEVFDIEMLRGDPTEALRDPRALLLSESAAAKFFPEDDPLGRTVSFDGRSDYKIAGLFRDLPRNSHLRMDILLSFAPIHNRNQDQWGISNYYTYLLLAENASIDALASKMPGFIDRHKGPESRRVYKFAWLFQPLTAIHLHSHWRGELAAGTKTGTLYIFSAVALFLLLIACFNVINLSTARYTNRAAEVGLRKVIGASRGQLIGQFLGESSLMTLLALPLTLVAVELAIPAANRLTGADLGPALGTRPDIWLFLAGALSFTALVSGLYPALFISAFRPASVLKGAFARGLSISFFRKGLVIFQFILSLVFISGALIISDQLRFMRSRDVGYDREHVVMLPINEPGMLERYETVKTEFRRDPRILAASATSYYPGEPANRQDYWREGWGEDGYDMIKWLVVDHDFLDTFRIKLRAGRGFSREFPRDIEGAAILNQRAVRHMEWDERSAVGKAFRLGWPGSVIGVVEDFNFRSLHQGIDPLVLKIWSGGFKYFAVRLRPGDIPGALAHLERIWNRFALEQPFEYTFLDESYDNLYRAEKRLGRIFGYVTALSILIACLGLFGLAAFAVEKRTKEIGIRKVLGSSPGRLIWLLSRDFAIWVGIAAVIAWPGAYYAMSRWLDNFAYRTGPAPWTFLLAAGIVLTLALATVGLRALHATTLDPIEVLRHE